MRDFKSFKINELKEEKEKVETTLLDSIGRDLTELAKEEKFDPTIGRVKEIDEVVAILARRRKNNPVLIGDPGVGKAQPLDSLVLTPNGWVRMGDLKVGDSVITPKGKKSRINGVYPQGSKDIYKIIFEDGRSAEACGEHLWKVYGIPEGKNRKRSWSIIDTDKIREVLENTNYKLKIPLIENIDIHNDSFIVEPYTMGILLGDGNIGENVVRFTTDDYQIYEMVKSEVSNELTVNKVTNNKNNRTDSYVININKDILPKTRYYKGDRLHTYLREFDNLKLTGVKSYDKFIPEKYKNSSFKSKLSIIQGLLDSDGGVTKTGSVYFNSASYRLVKDLQEIIWSIGGIASIKEKQTSYKYKGVKKEGRKSYTLSIRYKNPKELFRLERKKQRVSDNYQYSKLLKNNIVNVEYIGKKEAQCIMIDDSDHLYITNDYIVTHNTAIVEGIAQIIVNDEECPETLKGKRIIELDMASIMAGAANQGDLEKRVKRIIKELEDNPDVIVFIDEIHMIVDSNKPIDVSNMFKPALARGEMRCIGATTEKEYKIIEKDSALERRFQKVSVGEPTQEETIEILKRLKVNYGKYHGVEYSDDAILACVKLAGRYITDRFFPDKAIDLLDEVGARVRVKKTKSQELKDLEVELHKIGERKNALLKSQQFEEATALRTREKEIQQKLEELSKNEENIITVTKKDVENVMSKKLDLPELKSDDEDIAKKYLELSDKLKMDVIGQDEAVTKVSKLLRRNAAGLKDPNRPSGVFLFLGSTGVGKTHLVKTLAKNIFGSETALIRLDMSEYGEKHNVARLIGSPPGYVGYGEGGQLTEKVRRKPYSIILLDELEKAHPEVLNVLLQVFEDGHLTDGQGKKVDFKNTIIIMTSNIGARVAAAEKRTPVGFGSDEQKSAIQEENTKEIIKAELKKALAPEFLNRIDDIIIFSELSKDSIYKIIDVEVKKVSSKLSNMGYTLEITDSLKDLLIDKGYDSSLGARPLKRAIVKYIEDPISEEILRKSITDKIVMDYDKKSGKVLINGNQIIEKNKNVLSWKLFNIK